MARPRATRTARSTRSPSGPAPAAWRGLALLVGGGAAVLLAWMIARFWPFTVDDAYITLPYAANLAGGEGPVYNAEGAPAEGYTTFLWVASQGALAGSEGRSRLRLAAVVLVVTGASWLALSRPHAAVVFERRSYGLALEHTHVALGKLLAAFPGDRALRPLIALGDAGAVPYFSGWRVLDTFGPNEPAIGIEGSRDPAYVLGQEPDLVVLVSRGQREYETHETMPWEGALYEALLEAGMTRIAVMSFSPHSHLWVMGDPQSEVSRYVGREMRRLMEERSSG